MPTRVCSICKSPGVTKSTCPLNENAKNKNMKGHINAARKIDKYLKKKNTFKKSNTKQQNSHPPQKQRQQPQHRHNNYNSQHQIGLQHKQHKQPFQKSKPQHRSPSGNQQQIPERLPRIISLDNDECLGQFGLFSCLYVYARYSRDPYKVDLRLLRNACVKYLFPYGVGRPHLTDMFQLIKRLKEKGKINKLVMYTSAPNNLSDGKGGYVHFLKDCIEQYCGTPGIYDKVLHRNNVIARVSRCGATIKDLGNTLLTSSQRKTLVQSKNTKEKRKLKNYVNENTKYIFMVDDKPGNVNKRSGKVMGVSPYEYEGTSNIFRKCINSVPNLRNKLEFYKDPENPKQTVYEGILEEAEQNQRRYQGHRNNKDLLGVTKQISRLYR
jgi:hypothetical protein